MLSSGTKCYHLGLHAIIWDAMFSSGANVIIWDEMFVYLSRGVKYGRIVKTERVVFDHVPLLHERVQGLRGMPLVSFFTRAHSYILLCAAGG